jgi:hypothetical protein
MTPEEAIRNLKDLRNQLHTRSQHFAGECDQIQEQWTALGRAGGQRADHAASLLGRLRNHLVGMAAYCEIVAKQIDQMAADPFGHGQ